MLRSLDERIPKAANATDTIVRNLHPSSVTTDYMVQEKLNGVYVLWDGANLWTKTGHGIDVPTPFRGALPPAFPLVGELFFGYGHKPFQFATIVSQNKRPGKRTLAPGSSEASGSLVWMHARLVTTPGRRRPGVFEAFDTPMAAHLPYEKRHQLLWQIVASWSRTLTTTNMPHVDVSLLPLQVIAQYPLSKLQDLFQEVVHGTKWSSRTLLPFGIPNSTQATLRVSGGGTFGIGRRTPHWLAASFRHRSDK